MPTEEPSPGSAAGPDESTDYRHRIEQLRLCLRTEREALPASADDSDFPGQRDRVFEAASALVDYEQRVPQLIDAYLHRVETGVIRWVGMITTAVMGVVTLASVAIGVDRSVSIAFAALGALSALVAWRESVAAQEGQHGRMLGALLSAGASLAVVGVAAFGWSMVLQLALFATGIIGFLLVGGHQVLSTRS